MSQYVLVAGNFNTRGGMDRANYALAWYLADVRRARVHLVAHSVQRPLIDHPNVTFTPVEKRFNSYSLSEGSLRRAGRRAARENPGAHVICNGTNCDWPDVNWVHAVHAAWDCHDAGAPPIKRVHARLVKWRARWQERGAVGRARLVIANSEQTRRHVIEHLGVDPRHVRLVYLGVDRASFRPFDAAERAAARSRLRLPLDRSIVGFAGALGWDQNKGFDKLFSAHQQLCAAAGWDAALVAIGDGARVRHWQDQSQKLGPDRACVLGFVDDVPAFLAAIDLLVAPSRYESYGLAVHEALCCGVPALVSRSAGIAERYPESLHDLLLDDPTNVDEIVRRLRHWRENRETIGRHVDAFGEELRRYSWDDMAAEMVRIIEAAPESSAQAAYPVPAAHHGPARV